jgi:hypothetical protein
MNRLLYFLPFALVSAAWWSYARWLPDIKAKLDPTAELVALGTYGDSFGALNTLFSGLAFAAIVLSIYLQSKEIRETRREVEEQRSQQTKQVFENSFFQLLYLSNQIVKNFSYTSDYGASQSTSGKNCFEAIRRDFVSVALMSAHWGSSSEIRYEKFYLKHTHDELGHYFRNLYQVVKLVHFSKMPDKKFYTNIVRAQLSSHELYLLFYNGLSRFGRERFFPLLVEYEFFEHLPVDEELLQADAEKYGRKAFGASPEWHARFGQVAA